MAKRARMTTSDKTESIRPKCAHPALEEVDTEIWHNGVLKAAKRLECKNPDCPYVRIVTAQ